MSDANPFGQNLAQALQDVARLYVGHGRRYSQAALADATQIPLSTLKSYLGGQVSIPADNLLKLVAVLPAEAGNMLIRPCGYKLTPLDPEEDTWDAIGSEASMLTFEIFEAKQDGFIDHQERASLKKRAQSLVAKLDGVA